MPPGDRALATALTEQGFSVQPEIWSRAKPDWRDFDCVVVRSCWDYHLHEREFFEWIAMLERNGVMVLNTPNLLRWNARKTYLAELASSGIAIPDTIFLDSAMEEDLADVCKSREWRTAVVKPIVSASAHRTERKSSGRVRGPAILQQYVAAIETEGEWALVYIDGQFSHAVIKRPCAGDFRVQTEFGGSVVLAQPSAELLQFAESALHRLKWQAVFARVDVVAEESSVRLMELEVIEPELFLDLVPESGNKLASAIANQFFKRLGRI